MHDPSDLDPCYTCLLERHLSLVLSELPDSDDDFRVQQAHRVAQMLAAESIQWFPLNDRQLGWRNVLGIVIHEDQRANVVHEAVSEEILGLAAVLLEEPPEPASAYLKKRRTGLS